MGLEEIVCDDCGKTIYKKVYCVIGNDNNYCSIECLARSEIDFDNSSIKERLDYLNGN